MQAIPSLLNINTFLQRNEKNTNNSAFGFPKLVISLQEHNYSFNFRNGFFTHCSSIYTKLSMNECYKKYCLSSGIQIIMIIFITMFIYTLEKA